VKLILETDLAKHVEAIGRFRQEFLGKVACESPAHSRLVSTASQRKEFLMFTLKCADVAGSTKPFDLHAQWTMRINAEFFDQGDAERELGLPCSPFCDRQGTNVAESQRGFFDFIVKPLFPTYNDFLESRRLQVEVLAEMERNYSFWKRYDAAAFNCSKPMSNGSNLASSFRESCREIEDNNEAGEAPACATPVSKPAPKLLAPTLLSGGAQPTARRLSWNWKGNVVISPTSSKPKSRMSTMSDM